MRNLISLFIIFMLLWTSMMSRPRPLSMTNLKIIFRYSKRTAALYYIPTRLASSPLASNADLQPTPPTASPLPPPRRPPPTTTPSARPPPAHGVTHGNREAKKHDRLSETNDGDSETNEKHSEIVRNGPSAHPRVSPRVSMAKWGWGPKAGKK